MMRQLKIDRDDLETALDISDTSNDGQDAYLDLETGDVVYTGLEEITGDVYDFDPDDPRYLPIPKRDTREAYQEMEDFIATVSDEHIRELLWVAIDGRGAFGRFKGVLRRHPEVEDLWYEYKNTSAEHCLLAWLKSVDIEPDFKTTP